MTSEVDLVFVFRSSAGKVLTKPQARENTKQAAEQYNRLLTVLKKGGLHAVGKRGERDGQLLVLVRCPQGTLTQLARRERYSDFLCGLPSTNPGVRDLDTEPLSPADRLRMVHTYVTATPADGGLGVAPGSSEWDRVESVMLLHNHDFNAAWVRAWTTRQLFFVKFDKIREQFGEAVALYFHFLAFYTKHLIFISLASALRSLCHQDKDLYCALRFSTRNEPREPHRTDRMRCLMRHHSTNVTDHRSRREE